MMVKRFGIRFHDNDFYYTLLAFLEVMGNSENARRPWTKETLTKERVVFLFNSLAPGLYWARQNRFSHSVKRLHEFDDYLKIEEDNVYFDDEVDAAITKHVDGIWGSGEFHWIDLETNTIPSSF